MESSKKLTALFFISMFLVSSANPVLDCGHCGKPEPPATGTPTLPVPPVTLPPGVVPKLPVPPVTDLPGVIPKLPVPPVTDLPGVIPKLPVPPVTDLPGVIPKLPLPVPPVTDLPGVIPKLPVPPVTDLPGVIPKLPVPPVPGVIPKLPVPPVPGVIPKLPVPPVTDLPGVIPKLPLPPGVTPPTEAPCTPPAVTPVAPETCPIDTLKLGACVDLLGGLVHVGLGDPKVNKCCPILAGLAELEAAVCLCTTLKVNLLNLNIYLPVALELLATCGKTPPPGYTCSI